jgi:hypothetical protein
VPAVHSDEFNAMGVLVPAFGALPRPAIGDSLVDYCFLCFPTGPKGSYHIERLYQN